jgi:DNA-directed RNA polymerase subunit E'/Rpb7
MTTTVSVPADNLGPDTSKYIKSYIKSLKGTLLNGHIIIDIISINKNYDYGICDRINHNGSTDYRISFECIATCLTEGSVIILELNKRTIPKLYSGSCGNYYAAFILVNNLSINTSKFQVKDDNTIVELESDKNINEFSYFKCKVSDSKLKNTQNTNNTNNTYNSYNKNNILFVLRCFLIDIATKEEIEYYRKQEQMVNNDSKSIDDDINISNYV